jgi:ADP-ribosylglycohydrolase
VPESEVRVGIETARDLPPNTTVYRAARTLGNGSQVTCQDTVPFVLWCAGEALGSYEDALWLTAGGGGDRDTTCAMVGGIVVMYTGVEAIPAEWLARREPLPLWAVGEA